MKQLAVLVVLLAACGDAAAITAPATVPTTVAPTTVPAPGPDEVILEVNRSGGLCVEGACSTTFTVYGDGDVEISDADGYQIGEEAVVRLVAGLAIGSGELPAFTGTCPEAYDGPRYIYRFGATEIDSCVSDVSNSELIRLVHSLLRLATPYG